MSDREPGHPSSDDTGDEVLADLPTSVEPHGADAADADDVLDDAGSGDDSSPAGS